MKTVDNPPGLVKPLFEYSHVVVTTSKRLIFTAGQVAFNKEGNFIGEGDVEAQSRQVFENIGIALRSQGATFDDVLKLGTFITDRNHSSTVMKVRSEFIKKQFPASSLVVVKSLSDPRFLVEIEAIASKD